MNDLDFSFEDSPWEAFCEPNGQGIRFRPRTF